MIYRDTLMDDDIIVCSDAEEAKQAWNQFPQERHKIWTEKETWDHCLDSPEELQEILDKKKEKPGVY